MKRFFLVVLDSVGIGAMPDAAQYGDEGSNTLRAVAKSPFFSMPNMEKLGLFAIDGVKDSKQGSMPFTGVVARMAECSKGKDTTTGHWEIAGLVSEQPFPTFPNGFPKELLEAFSKRTGRGILCNKPYSGTEVIKDYGKAHIETGDLIVYTSADSVFQIAAHEDIVPVEQLYTYCEIARELCTGQYGVGRVIARPFEGEYPYKRTARRHDYSLVPPKKTILNLLAEQNFTVYAIGKIHDIFAGSGITKTVRTANNEEGILRLLEAMEEEFEGLCFVNLVDFDMVYGHRNDVDGYAKALTYFDEQLPLILGKMREEDVLLITADHGCDPSTPSTDHSREYTPVVMVGKTLASEINLGTRDSFADIGATVLAYFNIPKGDTAGVSFWNDATENS